MKKCLNCDTELHGPYCHQCGQSGSTHRYSLRTLFTHEVLHSLWHVDKSVFRSWWHVMVRPGEEARKNIVGQRAGQFPVLTLALFATILVLLTLDFRSPAQEVTLVRIGAQDYSQWVRTYAKWLWLGMILFFSLASAIYFIKSHYNLAEQIVTVTYIYVGTVSILAVVLFFSRLFPHEWTWPGWAPVTFFILYLSYAYWQSFRGLYSLPGWLWRYLATFLTGWLFLLCAILLLSVCLQRNVLFRYGSPEKQKRVFKKQAPKKLPYLHATDSDPTFRINTASASCF